jgi:hypothetical protein
MAFIGDHRDSKKKQVDMLCSPLIIMMLYQLDKLHNAESLLDYADALNKLPQVFKTCGVGRGKIFDDIEKSALVTDD